MDPEVAEVFFRGSRVWDGVSISEGAYGCVFQVLRIIKEQLGPQRYPEDLDCTWLIIEVQRAFDNGLIGGWFTHQAPAAVSSGAVSSQPEVDQSQPGGDSSSSRRVPGKRTAAVLGDDERTPASKRLRLESHTAHTAPSTSDDTSHSVDRSSDYLTLSGSSSSAVSHYATPYHHHSVPVSSQSPVPVTSPSHAPVSSPSPVLQSVSGHSSVSRSPQPHGSNVQLQPQPHCSHHGQRRSSRSRSSPSVQGLSAPHSHSHTHTLRNRNTRHTVQHYQEPDFADWGANGLYSNVLSDCVPVRLAVHRMMSSCTNCNCQLTTTVAHSDQRPALCRLCGDFIARRVHFYLL